MFGLTDLQSELFTPHCGILRRSNSDGRKRTVMFAASQQSDDSSASELIFVPPVSDSATKQLWSSGQSCSVMCGSKLVLSKAGMECL